MKKGVLLVNLGSPDSTATKDVKKYLGEFLMDERVIDIPYLVRALLVKGIILNTRPRKSAKAYRKIWWPEGSPLIVLSKRLHKKVQEKIELPVALAMRYGNPSLEFGLQQLVNQGVTNVMIVPLYPQFAMATTETILVLAQQLVEEKFPTLQLESLPAFYNKKEYIQNLAASIQEYKNSFQPDYILFSYHGVPERHIKKSDVTKSHCKIDGQCCITSSAAHEFCYRHQCYETTRQVAEALGLEEGTYSTSFQSRLGRDPWLQPYTDATIDELAQKGIKKLAVATPAFVSDCLETLEEIGMEAAHSFKENGGEDFLAIPCLNDREDWVATLSNWIKDFQNK
ncbi:ferrochelatase [Flavobacterium sp. 20NA77.7]|uniref:Ferrochelatase n=1 Tax=Flavobacterium nakdongensis TaxID=3073563 RepID=A0ABY9R926_9FLAO|nr:ferrochelatase [Flavobacterium sp. 20NA77.7]WMW77752.1 ferrochelatase [Flavobacterium sp. 20NA77.7]